MITQTSDLYKNLVHKIEHFNQVKNKVFNFFIPLCLTQHLMTCTFEWAKTAHDHHFCFDNSTWIYRLKRQRKRERETLFYVHSLAEYFKLVELLFYCDCLPRAAAKICTWRCSQKGNGKLMRWYLTLLLLLNTEHLKEPLPLSRAM